jgi:hypothetical protein
LEIRFPTPFRDETAEKTGYLPRLPITGELWIGWMVEEQVQILPLRVR